MTFKSTLIAAFAAATFAFPAMAEIEIRDQYARSSNAMSGGAFMTIHNTGGAPDRLLSVTSDAAERVELHTNIEDANGVMKMVQVTEGFVLPADGEIVLARGGEHIMFMGLTAPFEQDAIITVTLVFETAGEITVEIPVDQNRADAAHGTMDHGTMDHGTDG